MIYPNLLVNPGFNEGLGGWVVTQTPPDDTVTWQDGSVRFRRLGSANPASITQSIAVPNVPMIAKMFISEITSGAAAFSYAVGGQSYTTPGLKTLEFTPTGTLFRIQANANSDFVLDWAYLARKDSSMSNLILTLRDFDGDKKQTSVQMGPVTDGASYVTRKGQADALEAAVNAVAGNVARSQFLANDSEPNDVNAANLAFQTNIRWIVEWVDSVTGDGPYQTDIPTADIGNDSLVLPGSVEHDPAAAEWVAFKAAFNGIVVNPRTGSFVNITRIFLEQ